ncbi:hypothetical protein LL240_00445 [Oceanimonas baumannii]|uniref:hypothetical protein n=1 Tax=Oceanimonas baumannii TaxID=129578 RepID=UPI001D191A59|nr:hypothetical protein [Oceanimonas baumannii]MCC4262928.1 hypothetical protein [Oceanimonas baumannii]
MANSRGTLVNILVLEGKEAESGALFYRQDIEVYNNMRMTELDVEAEKILKENRLFMALVGKSSIFAMVFILLGDEVRSLGLSSDVMNYIDIWLSFSIICLCVMGASISSFVQGKFDGQKEVKKAESKARMFLEYAFYIGMMVSGGLLLSVVPEFYEETYTSITCGFVLAGAGFSLFYWNLRLRIKG